MRCCAAEDPAPFGDGEHSIRRALSRLRAGLSVVAFNGAALPARLRSMMCCAYQ